MPCEDQKRADMKESQEAFIPIRTVNRYVALRDAYTGQGGFSPKLDTSGRRFGRESWQRSVSTGVYSYLVPEPSELRYITRVMLTVYYNYMASLINCRVDPIFTRRVPRTVVTIGENEQETHHYTQWVQDVTGNGISKNSLCMTNLRNATLDGVCFLVMDTGENGRPYMYTQEAATVDRDMLEVSEWGHITQIAFVGDSRTSSDRMERVVWTDTTVTIQEKEPNDNEWTTVSTRDNMIGEIPVMPTFSEARMDTWEYLPFPAQSYGLMMACYSIFEGWSAYEWLKHTQGHSRMVFTNTEVEAITADGTTNAIVIQNPVGGSGASVAYISPDAAHMANALEAIKYKTEELIRIASEAGVDMAEKSSGQAESGLAKAFTYSARNDVLQRSRTVQIAVDEWIAETYKKYTGGGEWEACTYYVDDFTPKSAPSQMDLMEFAEFAKRNNMQLVFREAVKAMTGQLFQGNRELLAVLNAEIDVAPIANDAGRDVYSEDDEE